MKRLILFFLPVIIWMFLMCEYTPVTMPGGADSSNTFFNPGVVRYIPLNPAWNGGSLNFKHPVDIFISVDDYIFIADSGDHRVVVLDKTGKRVEQDEFGNDFTELAQIPDPGQKGAMISPIGLTVDSKLNLFIVDRSDRVYVWNQFINNRHNSQTEGQDSIATALVYRNAGTGDRVTVTDWLQSYALEAQNYYIEKAIYEAALAKIDSLLKPHVFYAAHSAGASRFVSVAAAPFGQNLIYVTDQGLQRIAIIAMVRSAYLKLRDGTTVWQHTGYFAGNAATDGTGAGTVNDPGGIYVDDEGSIYYTQFGKNFGFHKISRQPNSNVWISVFTLGQHEIMNLNQFDKPADVTVDNDGNIFVLNTGQNEVQEFDNRGTFIRKAGLREIQIDTTVVDTIASGQGFEYVNRDTIITHYYNDVLNQPRGISVSDGVIYIVDSGNNRILRYKLSSDIDIELPE